MCALIAFAAAKMIASLRNVVGSENCCVPVCPSAFGKYLWNEAIVPADAPRQV